MTLTIAAALYGVGIAVALLFFLRWEFRRARGGRSARHPKPASERTQKALSRWLAGLGSDKDKKDRSREAA